MRASLVAIRIACSVYRRCTIIKRNRQNHSSTCTHAYSSQYGNKTTPTIGSVQEATVHSRIIIGACCPLEYNRPWLDPFIDHISLPIFYYARNLSLWMTAVWVVGWLQNSHITSHGVTIQGGQLTHTGGLYRGYRQRWGALELMPGSILQCS